jgi:SAM-dependent methyltransferase
MHREALQWVVRHAPSGPLRVLDLGGRNINGSVRDVWDSAASFTVLDIEPGPGVDIVADAGDWMPDPDARFDVVTCCEVFEHTDRMIAICRTAWRACVSGGRFIVTCAGPGRAPHSCRRMSFGGRCSSRVGVTSQWTSSGRTFGRSR